MKRIYSSLDNVSIGHVVSMLEDSGIEHIVRNRYLSGAMGELPVNECWPEVWVARDADYEAAMEIVRVATAQIRDAGPWRCRQCGEHNEGQFASCWKCSADRTDAIGE